MRTCELPPNTPPCVGLYCLLQSDSLLIKVVTASLYAKIVFVDMLVAYDVLDGVVEYMYELL